MEPEAVAPWGQLGLCFLLQSLGKIMCLNKRMSGISSGRSFFLTVSQKSDYFLRKSRAFLWGRDTGLVVPCSWRFWIVRSLQIMRCLFQFQLWLRENKFLIACKRKQTENSSDVFHVPYFFFQCESCIFPWLKLMVNICLAELSGTLQERGKHLERCHNLHPSCV